MVMVMVHIRSHENWLYSMISGVTVGYIRAAATGYELDDGGIGVRVSVWLQILTTPYRPDRL
jgi:hypothetical protein